MYFTVSISKYYSGKQQSHFVTGLTSSLGIAQTISFSMPYPEFLRLFNTEEASVPIEELFSFVEIEIAI